MKHPPRWTGALGGAVPPDRVLEGHLKTLPTLALTGLLSLSAPAWAGDFVDTRLSFVFADDNVLANAGETTPNSPNARFGAGNQNTQFYDNFNTKFSGFETLSNMVLYKRMPAFFEGLTTEAALTLLVLERPSGGVTLRDNSSYIRLNYRPRRAGARRRASRSPASRCPRTASVWATPTASPGAAAASSPTAPPRTGVPGVKLQITRDRWYAFVGGKTALVLNDLILEQETLYGLMAGAGVDIAGDAARGGRRRLLPEGHRPGPGEAGHRARR